MITAILATLLTFTPPSPLESDITQDPAAQAGLLCWWTCMAVCIVTGKTHQQCEMICDEMCYAVTTPPPDGPTCEPPDEGPVACLGD